MEEAIRVIQCALESSDRCRISAGFNAEHVRLYVIPACMDTGGDPEISFCPDQKAEEYTQQENVQAEHGAES